MQENVVFVRWFTRITHALHNDMYDKFKHHLWPLGSSAPEPVAEEEDDGAELEEEELEPVQVSETEFNFLDFIKRWAKSAEVKLSLAVEHMISDQDERGHREVIASGLTFFPGLPARTSFVRTSSS